MADKRRAAGNLELVGGRLCLDFANTVSTRNESLRREYLTCYDDLVEWSRHAGILTDHEAQRLKHEATRHPVEAAAVLDEALATREVIYRIFSAIAHQQAPAAADVTALNAALAEALGRLRIRSTEDGFEWQWVPDPQALDAMLWPIVRSAADLLISAELHRVGQCARHGSCDWLFVDSSKNRSRRWCSMNACGSRDKAHRYYQRKRAERRGSMA